MVRIQWGHIQTQSSLSRVTGTCWARNNCLLLLFAIKWPDQRRTVHQPAEGLGWKLKFVAFYGTAQVKLPPLLDTCIAGPTNGFFNFLFGYWNFKFGRFHIQQEDCWLLGKDGNVCWCWADISCGRSRVAAAPSRWGFYFPFHHRLHCSLLPHTQGAPLTDPSGLPLGTRQFAPCSTAWSSFSPTQESFVKQRSSSFPFRLPRRNIPGVLKLELGPRWAMGVDGTEPVACTAVSVLSASTELGLGVLGFSCFCCTANSCRKSGPGKGFGLSPCFGWRGRGKGSSRHTLGKRKEVPGGKFQVETLNEVKPSRQTLPGKPVKLRDFSFE